MGRCAALSVAVSLLVAAASACHTPGHVVMSTGGEGAGRALDHVGMEDELDDGSGHSGHGMQGGEHAGMHDMHSGEHADDIEKTEQEGMIDHSGHDHSGHGHDHSGHGMHGGEHAGGAVGEGCNTSTSFARENGEMHAGMENVRFNCDLNIDFVVRMRPHHLGGIGICKTYLASGDTDAELARYCEAAIELLISEEEWMGAWLLEYQADPATLRDVDPAECNRSQVVMNQKMAQMHSAMATIVPTCNPSYDLVRYMLPFAKGGSHMCAMYEDNSIAADFTMDASLQELCANMTESFNDYTKNFNLLDHAP